MTKKLLRKVSVFGFSFLVFLLFLVASGFVRARGAEMGPGMRIRGYRGSVDALTIDSLLRSSLVENSLSNLPAAPDADVDLQAILADFPDPVHAGSELTYTVDILNNSPVTATLVILTDTLPQQVMLLSAIPSQGSCTNAVCELGDLEGGAAATVTFTVQVDPSFNGTLDNLVEVTSSDNELDPSDNVDSEQTTVELEADLEIVKTDDPDPVYPGDPLTYILEITNHGPSDAMNVRVNDDFLPALTFISSDPGFPTCRRTGTEIDCELGDLGAGNTTQVTLFMSVKTDAPNPLLNLASVTSDTPDPDPSNNGASENTEVILQPDLGLTTVDDPDPVPPGEILTYTLTVNNIGLTDAVTVVLTDSLPVEVSLLSSNPSQGTCLDLITGTTCSLGTIGIDAGATVSLVTQVDLGATGVITNMAQVSTPNDSNTGNNVETETTFIDVGVALADLSITKSDFPDPVAPGGLLTYVVDITNNGPDSATNVVVTDTLPAEVSLLTSTPSQGTCSDTDAETVCSLGTLDTGASATVIVETQVDADALGLITNTAEVSSPDDPQPSDNVASEDTSVVDPTAEADLSILKTASHSIVYPGQFLTYTLDVENLEQEPEGDIATNVTVTDTLPAEVTFVSSQPDVCSESGGVVTCGSWDLGPTETTAVNILVEVDPTAIGPLVNQAGVASDVFDPVPSNNEDSISTNVEPSADLAVTTIAPDQVDPGGTLTYTITVINNGPFTTGGVTLVESLPADVTLISIDPSQGTCIDTLCSLGTIANGASVQVIVVGQVSLEASGVLTNTAVVSGGLYDPFPENDISVAHTTVGAGTDLSLTKTASPDPVVAGDFLTYTLSIHNQGLAEALSVSLEDTIPANVTFLSATPGAPTCAHSGGVLTCNLGTIAPDETRTVSILVFVDASATGTLTNQAQVSSLTFDEDLSNNEDQVATQIETSADLALGISDSPDPVPQGAELLYTINVINFGPSVSRDLVLTVQLPVSTTVLSVSPGAPTCIQDQGLLVCSLSVLSSGADILVSLNMLVDSDASGDLILQATLSSSTQDPDGGNNTVVEDTTVLIPDRVPPTVAWVYPVGNEQSYNVGTEILPLEADASDNVDVERVDFFWWDPDLEQFIDIGSDFDAPYRVDFDTSVLDYGYNQVYVRAYDTSGNASNRPRILLFRLELEYTQYLPVVAR